jgi:spermidine/putrescine transport system substrate-binding protein
MSTMSRKHGRTALHGIALVLGGALVLAACGGDEDEPAATSTLDPDADLSQQSLVISNYEAYMPDDLPKRFEKETGASTDVTYHATNEEIVAKLTATDDPGIDIAFLSGSYAQALAEQGELEVITPELIPNLANLYPEADDLAYDPGNKISVPYAWGTTGLCYREDLTGYDPTSWNDLLEPKPEVEGKTTMIASERWLALPAQKALGFSVNTTDPDELAQVQDQLLATKPTLLAYDDSTFYQRLIDGEASLVQAWDGWCNYGIAEDERIKWVVPDEGSDLWTDVMVIPASSENKEAAHAFINYVLQPEVHSWVVENILYKVPNQAAMEEIDPSLIEAFPNLGMTVTELFEQEEMVDLGEDAPMYTEMATTVTAG